MKRFLSILIALVLLVSMFAVTAVAVAETSPRAAEPTRVEFDSAVFKEHVKKAGLNFYLEMDRTFMFADKWWEDAELVHQIFPGINYRYQPKEDLEGKEEEYKVYYDYSNPEEGDPYTESQNAFADKTYKETQHFRLPSAPKAIEDEIPAENDGDEVQKKPRAYFAGWEIVIGVPAVEESEGEGEVSGTALETLPVHLQGVFAANTDIAMPAGDITIKAVWVANESDESEQQAKDAAQVDDKIYLFYVSPSGSTTQDMKDWSRCLVTSSLSLTTEGEWNFRFAVVDGKRASESGYSFDYDDVLATTFDDAQKVIDEADAAGVPVVDKTVRDADCTLTYYVKDTTAPKIKLSTTQQNKVNDGLTVGTTYSVSTSLDITDCSTTTVTYIVEKFVGDVEGATDGYLKIYDSVTREVTEGYENNITTGGVITPLAEDVTGENVYRITYTVVDAYGNHAVEAVNDDEEQPTEEFHPVMLLKVNPAASTSTSRKTIETWKIILYVVAGLSAVGIVVLLFVNPKKATADNRYNAKNEAEPTTDDQTNDQNGEDK